jgi:hypothetical protein
MKSATQLANRKGSMILSAAIFMAVLAGLIYFYSNVQLLKVTSQYRRTQSMAYAHQISAALAQNLRWSYDTAASIAANPLNAPACSNGGGAIVTVPGTAVKLCLVGGQTCTAHPGNPNRAKVCVGIANQTLFGKRTLPREPADPLLPGRFYQSPSSRLVLLVFLSASALAQVQGYSPGPPPVGGTANDLPAVGPVCIGDVCQVRCGPNPANADCLSFKFCPLLGDTCDPTKLDDWVTQTIALLKN